MSEEKKYNKEELKKIANQIVEKHTTMMYDNVEIPIHKDAIFLTRIGLGTFVTIRSCRDNDPKDLMLGVYIGGVNIGFPYQNPAFYVFKLKNIILGCESWWSPIEETDLDLGCDGMKKKNAFSWKDIQEECKIYATLLNLKASEHKK